MHLKFHILFVSLLISAVVLAQTSKAPMTAEQYIENFKDDAIKEMQLFNIPASITLAQGMLESGNGNSDLAIYANNHFGIKCHNEWTGPTFTKDDDEKDECFRKYPTALDSYTDHSNFLKTRSRYAFLFELKRTDYKGWARGLKKVGYATDPKYPRRLIDLIETYKLYQYDHVEDAIAKTEEKRKDKKTEAFVLKNDVPVKEKSQKNEQDSKSKNERKSKTSNTVSAVKKAENVKAPEAVERHVTRPVEQFRFINYVIIKPGDTFTKIAKETDKDVWQLYKFNDLKPTDKLTAGERMYLQPKRRNGKEPFHIVKKGETMRSISQLHAIKLTSLYKKNLMNPGEEPKVGETLYLRQTKKAS
jgi:LysM repeat protein